MSKISPSSHPHLLHAQTLHDLVTENQQRAGRNRTQHPRLDTPHKSQNSIAFDQVLENASKSQFPRIVRRPSLRLNPCLQNVQGIC